MPADASVYMGRYDAEPCYGCGARFRVEPHAEDCGQECTCVHDCAEYRSNACSLSGDWHVHPASSGVGFGPCPVHPDAPGDH